LSRANSAVCLARTLYGGCGEFKRERTAKNTCVMWFFWLAIGGGLTHVLGCSQGGAKLPTGGKRLEPQARERRRGFRRVSRSGAMPEPTVIVRMKENPDACGSDAGRWFGRLG